MKKPTVIATVIAAVVVIGAGAGYWAYDYYAGNSVEVKSVISTPSPGAAATSPSSSAQAAQLDGTWSIQSNSEVYFSVTTSKETVNFAVKPVTGSWQLNTASLAENKAEAAVTMSGISSGNSQRDNHIKGNEYLSVEQFPQSTFVLKSVDALPNEWKPGETINLKLTGTLTVRGTSKEVTFDSKAQYDQGQLKLEGSTTVTFADFGMKNPHTVLLDTQNDVLVSLRLILAK